MQPSRNIDDLRAIMARLRDPETGCAWDVEQTYATIAPHTIEEAYEVADAIERDDQEDLREELGDLLLQVVFQSRIAEENGAFAFDDVVEAITTKMIRRHPHVFGDESARSPKMAKGMWEKIKAEEKAEKRARRSNGPLNGDAAPGLLDDVPSSMPGLLQAKKLQDKAARVGFDWDKADQVLDKMDEEIRELRAEIDAGRQDETEAEIGDLLFALVNLARHTDCDPERALRRTNAKFRRRFAQIEAGLQVDDTSLEDADLEHMERLWQQAKTQEHKIP